MGRDAAPDLLPGTLELLILKTLAAGEMHGYGIAQRVKALSGDVLEVGESSLYPALQRLLVKGWVRTFRNSQFIAINDGSTIRNLQAVIDFNRFDSDLLKRITTGACSPLALGSSETLRI